MHETGMVSALVRRIQEAAAAEGAQRVVGVSVWLGALCHMSPEHFAEHFEQAAAGTPAAGARLDVTASDDASHPEAQNVLLESIEVEV